jgi:mannose-6-phosphate isomerase
VSELPLYPLQFEPIYQYRPWGGRRLASLLSAPLSGNDPVGEAWVLSDRDQYPSRVAHGHLTEATIGELLERWPEQMLGKLAGRFTRFPLLFKFLDVRDRLSVQVHPSDQQLRQLPAGDGGKTEAWVVLQVGPHGRVYAGLNSFTTKEALRRAVVEGTLADHLASFTPQPGETVLVKAGTVHSLGDVVVFEVQQNSDVTFRLYDWQRVDPKTGSPRCLQVDRAMDCLDLSQGAVAPSAPVVESMEPVLRERLLTCEQFGLWRHSGGAPFSVGAPGSVRVLACTAGAGQLEYDGAHYPFGTGDLLLLPAAVGACLCRPLHTLSLLEVSLPETPFKGNLA